MSIHQLKYRSHSTSFFPPASTTDRAEEQSPGGQRSAETFTSLLMTPKPITELIGGEKGDSSVIKYRVTTTPGYVNPSAKTGTEMKVL